MRYILRKLGHVWCFIVHDIIQDKHKMLKPYGPYHCQKCGRVWSLF